MASINRLVVRMDGWPGAPGFMTFYSNAASGFANNIVGFLTPFLNAIPSVVTFTVPASGDIIDDATGALTGTWSDGSDNTFSGTASGAFAAPAGVCVNWLTTNVVNGRRLRGRTFIVPLAPIAYQSDGSITAASLATFNDASSSLVSDGQLVIWHRPTSTGGSDGSSGLVTGSRVADRVAVLTSRRA